MTDAFHGSVGWQDWRTVNGLALAYKVSTRTIREWIQLGRFGTGPDYVLDVSGHIVVSTLGDFFFRQNYQAKLLPMKSDTIRARNPAELKRKLEAVDE